MQFSCAFLPSMSIVRYAQLAEELGFTRAWAADSPAVYGDIWVALARIAEHTTRIGLGSSVVVPSLRHPLVTASAIATIAELAPGRLACGFGTGFSARRALGKRPMRWADMRTFLLQLRGLLRGEVVEIEGKACQMIHSPGYAPARPISVPLLVGAGGPKGFAVARELGDGLLCDTITEPGFAWCGLIMCGTVLESGEDHTTPRVREALGPWWVYGYHRAWEENPAQVAQMPGGVEWLARLEAARPEGQRYLSVHEGHVVAVNELDRPLLDVAGPALLTAGWTGLPETYAERIAAAEAQGVTEIIYVPAGPDIPRELRAFAAATGVSP